MTTRKKKPAAAPAGNNGFSLISNEKLLALYAAMLRCRIAGERMHLLAAQQQAILDGAGNEASTAAITIDLLPQDAISPARGSLLAHLLNSNPLKKNSRRRGTGALPAGCASAQLIHPPATIAGQLASARRAARRIRQAKSDGIVVLFCGCEQPPAAVWQRCLQSAAAERLPILFVCHANADAEDFAPKAHEYGLPAIPVDAADVVAIYRVASEAIAHARRGNGPTLIECKPWIESNSVAASRANRNRRSRVAADPIRTMEKYLTGKGLFSRRFKAETIRQFKAKFPSS